MTDKRKHRGAHPKDAALFAPEHHEALRSAVADLSWLLSRRYATPSALKIVGDRYSLTARQRQAVARCACGDNEAAGRREKEARPSSLDGGDLLIDGFNVLTTLETALSGGPIFPGRDGCYRDIAGIHGNYRVLEETEPALELVQDELGALGVRRARWFFDRPVSNSGRVKALLAEIAESPCGPGVDIQLVPDPDPVLAASGEVIATSDSAVLDACGSWFNLARHLIAERAPDANVVPLVPVISNLWKSTD